MQAARTVAMAFPRQSCANVSDDSYGCVAPKLYGRFETIAKALRAKAVRTYRAVAKAVSHQSCADVSRR